MQRRTLADFRPVLDAERRNVMPEGRASPRKLGQRRCSLWLSRRTVGSASQLPVTDPVRLVGFGAEALPFVLFVLTVVAVEPNDAAVAFEGEDVRGHAIEKPAVV